MPMKGLCVPVSSRASRWRKFHAETRPETARAGGANTTLLRPHLRLPAVRILELLLLAVLQPLKYA